MCVCVFLDVLGLPIVSYPPTKTTTGRPCLEKLLQITMADGDLQGLRLLILMSASQKGRGSDENYGN